MEFALQVLVILRDEDIAICLEYKAKVEEVLAGGITVPLGFDNYNTYNGPSKFPNIQTAKAITEGYSEPVVETVTGKKEVEVEKTPVVEEKQDPQPKESLEQTDMIGSVEVENTEASPKKDKSHKNK